MRYVPKHCVGFEMTDALVEALDIGELWETWDGDEHDPEILETIEEKFGVVPYMVARLVEERGGERTGIEGFEDGMTYLLFESRDTRVPDWKEFSELCESAGSQETEGSWSQLM